MKFSCDTAVFCEAVANVSRAVSQKTSLPILSGLFIRADDHSLTLTGYDLEMGITTTIEAMVEERGELVLPARLLFDMLRRLPSERVSLFCDEKYLTTIRGGVAEYTLLAMDPAEFPDMPAPAEENRIEISEPVLKSMIAQTVFAVAVGDSKPIHTGSKFHVGDGQLVVVSVDGFRLALRREPVSAVDELSFVVPGKTLSELVKILRDDPDAICTIAVSRKHAVFTVDGYSVVSRLLEGDFLDYNSAIPKGSATTVRVSVRELIESVERTSLLITDRLRSPLKFQIGADMIDISCSTAIGKAVDKVACKAEGPALEIGFNNRYLLDALKNCESDEVLMELGGSLSPMKILPPEGDSSLFLVLPVRM